MRILVVADEYPFPPVHGALVDIYNRLISLRDAGAEILLLTWNHSRENDTAEIVVDLPILPGIRVISFPFDRGIRRVANTFRIPWLVAKRTLKRSYYESFLKTSMDFKPDFLFIDGLYPSYTGMKLARDLGLKAGIRLHNVEADYMKGQFWLSTSLKERLSIGLSLMHLRKYEERTIRRSDAFFDISLDDLNKRKTSGLTNGYWLPPVYIKKTDGNHLPDTEDVASDICFFGNLNTPNNLLALKWFIDMIYPLVKRKIPGVSFLIMGFKPSEYLYRMTEGDASIKVVASPLDPAPYLNKTRVLINPIKFGSGVNVKTIDMLFQDKPVVTTSIGVRGLPADFNTVFNIADEPEEFAGHITLILAGRARNIVKERAELRKKFGSEAVEIISKVLSEN